MLRTAKTISLRLSSKITGLRGNCYENDISQKDDICHEDDKVYGAIEEDRKTFCKTFGCQSHKDSDPLRCPYRCPELGCPELRPSMVMLL